MAELIYLRVKTFHKDITITEFPKNKLHDEPNVYHAEIQEIQKHRRVESRKAGCDVGEEWAAVDWIKKHAKSFRAKWNKCHG